MTPNPFVLKVGDYPPIRSWPIVPFYECTLDTMHYLSFDSGDLHGPIRYKLPEGDTSIVQTYRFDSNYNYISGYEMTIVPPDSVFGPPDIIVKYNGDLQDVSWDTTLHPWQNAVFDVKPYQPHNLTIDLIGPSQVNQGTTNEYMVKIDGGHGIYAINWYVKSETDNQFTQEQSNFPFEDKHKTFYILNNQRIIFYENEHKYNFELLESYADIIVEVFDMKSEYVEHSVRSDTMRIYRLPEPITFINDIQTTENYGHLILNENKSDPIASGDDRVLFLGENYSIRTDELPFIPNFNSTSQKHHRWITTSEANTVLNKNFTFDSESDREMKSRFEPTKPASVKVKIDGVEVNVGNFGFKDPWHYYEDVNGNWLQSNPDNFENYTSPLKMLTTDTTQYGGVFLDQNPDPVNPNIPYYSVSIDAEQTIDYNGSNHKIHFTSWSSSNADLEAATSPETAVVFTDADAEVYANHKGSLTSNSDGALGGVSQRKLARTSDGNLFVVYESMGKVWCQQRINTDWYFILDEIAPLSGLSSKLPSIATNGNNVIVAYQENNNGYSNIVLKYFDLFNLVASTKTITTTESYNLNMIPVISFSTNDEVMVIWRRSGGLGYGVFPITNNQIGSSIDSGTIPNTTSVSNNPSIAGILVGSSKNYHIVWQESTSKIKYIRYYNNGGTKFYDYASDISSGSGYTVPRSPEVTVTNANNVWVGWWAKRVEYDDGGPDLPTKFTFPGGGGTTTKYRALLREKVGSSWQSNYRVYGNNVSEVGIDRTTDGKFAFSFSEEESLFNFTTWRNSAVYSSNFTNVIASSNGKYFKMSNSFNSTFGGFSAVSLSTESELKTIDQAYVDGSLQKTGADNVIIGREGIAYRDSVQFYFAVGGIYVDGVQIEFIEMPDTDKVLTKNELNSYLKTEPFTLTDVSDFQYGVVYGLADSTYESGALKEGENLKFRVKLVENATNNVIGIYDEVLYNIDSIFSYNNVNYLVETSGVGNKEVRLELELTDNFEQQYSCSEMYLTIDTVLSKSFYRDMNYRGSLIEKDYELVQNYPNPFNPSTTIKYNIPKEGIVRLRVYDILGKEIKTLVNSFQPQGRYEVAFDASRLSSGIYIYRLEVNDFVTSKKMMLVK